MVGFIPLPHWDGHWWLLNCTYHTTFFPHVHKATMDFMVYGSPCCLGALGRCRDSTAADWTSPTARRVHSRPRRERAPSPSGRSSPAEVIRSPDGKCGDSSYVRIVWKMDTPATLTFFGGEREREHDKYPEDFLANRFWDSDLFADGDDSRWSLCPVLGTSWRTKVISSRVFASVSQPEGGLRFQTGNPRFS